MDRRDTSPRDAITDGAYELEFGDQAPEVKDSSALIHAGIWMSLEDTPFQVISGIEDGKSRGGLRYTAANGSTIPNRGEKQVEFRTSAGQHCLLMIQAATVRNP